MDADFRTALRAVEGAGNDAFTPDATNKNFANGSYLDVDAVDAAGNDTTNIIAGQVTSSLVSIRTNLGLATTTVQSERERGGEPGDLLRVDSVRRDAVAGATAASGGRQSSARQISHHPFVVAS